LKSPPRFIPTLTEVVDSPGAQKVDSGANTGVAAVAVQKTEPAVADLSALSQRVHATLQPRIQAAVTVVVQAHLKSLGPLIEKEIERVVRDAVQDAMGKHGA
jgi:hypothetical protein